MPHLVIKAVVVVVHLTALPDRHYYEVERHLTAIPDRHYYEVQRHLTAFPDRQYEVENHLAHSVGEFAGLDQSKHRARYGLP